MELSSERIVRSQDFWDKAHGERVWLKAVPSPVCAGLSSAPVLKGRDRSGQV